MPVKKMKPTSPGRRFMTISSFEEITKTEPEKVLTESLKRHSGRNNQGRVTVRHRGGGHKRLYRRIDFKRDKDNMPAKVIAVEYDPNRSARIALLQYEDSERRYILHPVGLNVGDVVASGADAEFGPGNCLPLENIPDGTVVHAIEMMPGRGAQLCRSAGASAQLMAKEGRHALLRLPSGEMRLVPRVGRATIGQVGNTDHELINIGKAGRNRHLGWRPTVRGSAMNVDDHPHGGGEGKAPIGMPSPKSPWGWRTRGRRTRKRKNASDQFIVQSRRKKRR